MHIFQPSGVRVVVCTVSRSLYWFNSDINRCVGCGRVALDIFRKIDVLPLEVGYGRPRGGICYPSEAPGIIVTDQIADEIFKLTSEFDRWIPVKYAESALPGWKCLLKFESSIVTIKQQETTCVVCQVCGRHLVEQSKGPWVSEERVVYECDPPSGDIMFDQFMKGPYFSMRLKERLQSVYSFVFKWRSVPCVRGPIPSWWRICDRH